MKIWTFRKGGKILAMETIEDYSTFQGGTLLQKKVLMLLFYFVQFVVQIQSERLVM